MLISKLLKNIKYINKNFSNDFDIKNLSINSKEKNSNGIFFCIAGNKYDGHDFVDQSINNGTICLVVERLLPIDIPQVVVENMRQTISKIAMVFYRIKLKKLKFIAITGTNGKTSTTHIIYNILKQLKQKVGLIGTEGVCFDDVEFSTGMTTPDSIEFFKIIRKMQDRKINYIVMEVSAHAIYYEKLYGIKYDTAGLTNITQDHLDFFKNMKNYIKTKQQFIFSDDINYKYINIDDKYAKNAFNKIHKNKISLSIQKDADYSIKITKRMLGYTECCLYNKNQKYNIKTNLIGDYNIQNLLMAIAICNKYCKLYKVIKIINNYHFVIKGRINIFQDKKGSYICIDYAHSPDGLEKVISLFKNIEHKKIITVFGCGGNRDTTKRPIMGRIATELSDYVIVTSDNPRYEKPKAIIQNIISGIKLSNFAQIIDRKKAILSATKMAKENDIVIICGKGAENYQEVNGKKIPYSDIDYVKEIIDKG